MPWQWMKSIDWEEVGLSSSYLSLHWALQRARSSLSLTPPLSQVNFVSENPISIRPQSWIHWANLRQYTPKFLRPLLLAKGLLDHSSKLGAKTQGDIIFKQKSNSLITRRIGWWYSSKRQSAYSPSSVLALNSYILFAVLSVSSDSVSYCGWTTQRRSRTSL